MKYLTLTKRKKYWIVGYLVSSTIKAIKSLEVKHVALQNRLRILAWKLGRQTPLVRIMRIRDNCTKMDLSKRAFYNEVRNELV